VVAELRTNQLADHQQLIHLSPSSTRTETEGFVCTPTLILAIDTEQEMCSKLGHVCQLKKKSEKRQYCVQKLQITKAFEWKIM
jgi:hypothetical protein